MLHRRPGACWRKVSDLSGAHEDWTNTHGIAGGPRWRTRRRRDRPGVTTRPSAGAFYHPNNLKVLLWVVVSLLPLVEGARIGAGLDVDSAQALGLVGGMGDRQLPDTLPEVDEEQEEESDPYSPWHGLYNPSVMDEEDDHPSGRWGGRSPRNSDPSDGEPKGSAKKKKKRKKKEREKERDEKRKSSPDCRVEKREMRVRDLGLGFDSDEIVLFKFCVGSCQSSRTNYDLALRALMKNGSLPRRTSRRVSAHPCCRPDRYEPVSFMDANTTWQTIQSLSAASCMCMG